MSVYITLETLEELKTQHAEAKYFQQEQIANSQAAGARASTIGSCSPANDSPTRAEGHSDQTYAMCKEICKEVSESVLRCINEWFDAFEAKFNALAASQAELQTHVANQEQAISDLDVRMLKLEAKCTELMKHNAQLHTKVLDLEACSRRHNIKLVGIPDDEEEGRPTDCVSKLIPKLLGEEHLPHPVKVDRAHRSLQPKPATGTKPRTILARIHHFQKRSWFYALADNNQWNTREARPLFYLYPDSFSTAIITVIHQKNKDPLKCSSYQPISLLNTDYKIISMQSI